jgi:hypothetical protein
MEHGLNRRVFAALQPGEKLIFGDDVVDLPLHEILPFVTETEAVGDQDVAMTLQVKAPDEGAADEAGSSCDEYHALFNLSYVIVGRQPIASLNALVYTCIDQKSKTLSWLFFIGMSRTMTVTCGLLQLSTLQQSVPSAGREQKRMTRREVGSRDQALLGLG